MWKLALLPLFIALSSCSVLISQSESAHFKDEYIFKDETGDYDFSQNNSNISSHYLGNEIAVKMDVLKDTYTYIEKATPTSPTDKTIVVKPTIYYAIKKLSNKYKRFIKKDQLTEQEARKRLDKYIMIALSIYHQETDEFEEELRKNKKPHEIEQVFDKVTLE